MSKLLTSDFIENLYNWFGPHCVTVRWYDHAVLKKGESAPDPVQTPLNKLAEYNSPKQKFSIFFTPNGALGLADRKGQRKDTDATILYCIFVDIDQGYDKETGKCLKEKTRENFPLEPTIINETYNGYHLFRLFEGPIIITDEIRKLYKEVMNYMVYSTELRADKNPVNLSRMLRMPGFSYRGRKQGETDTPFYVDTLDINDNRYRFEDFVHLMEGDKKFKEQIDFKSFQKKAKTTHKQSAREDIYAKVRVEAVLEDLCKGQYQVKGLRIWEGNDLLNGYRVMPYANGITADFQKDKKTERPNGGPFQIARFYHENDFETFQYFYKRRGIGEDYKKTVQMKVENENGEVVENYKGKSKGKKKREGDPDVMTGMPTIEIDKDSKDLTIRQGSFAVKINFKENITYVIGDGGEEVQVMDASLKAIGYYIDSSLVHIYIVEYARSNGEFGVIYLKKLGKNNELVVRLSEKGINFYGNPKVEKFITSYIHSTTNKMKYIDAAGIYAEDMIVNKAGCYIMENKTDRFFVDIDDLEPRDSEKNEIFTVGEDQGLAQFRTDLQTLETTYKSSIIYSLFLSYAIGLFSHYIRKEFKFIPSSGLVGVSASGKTTARELVLEMLGLDYCTVVAASTTRFVAVKKGRHFLPLTASEYDELTIQFSWDELLKNNYDGAWNERGTSDQKTVKYPASASRCVDGETGSMTNSVNTRKISMQFSKAYQRGIMNPKFIKNINGYLIHNYNKIHKLKENYMALRGDISNFFKDLEGNEKERVIDNYTMLIAFADCFGFADIIMEPVLQQAKDQFALAGDDMIPKLIKQVLMQAMVNKLVIRLEGEHLNIDFIADTLRLDAKKLATMQSNIKNVNHFFNIAVEGGYTGYDKLEVPLEYIFKTKSLHPMFNSLLNLLSLNNTMSSITEDSKVIGALKVYAQTNGYTKQRFYEIRLKEDVEREHKMREQDKDKPF